MVRRGRRPACGFQPQQGPDTCRRGPRRGLRRRARPAGGPALQSAVPEEVLRAAQGLVGVSLEAVVALEDRLLPEAQRGLLAELFRGRICHHLVSLFAGQAAPAVACTTMLAGKGRSLHGLRLRLSCTQQQWQLLLVHAGAARVLEVPGGGAQPPLRVFLRAGQGLAGVPPPSVLRLRLQLPPAAAWLAQLELPHVAAALAGAGLAVQEVCPVLLAGGLRSAGALGVVVGRDPALPELRGSGQLELLLPALAPQPARTVCIVYTVQAMPQLPALRLLQPPPPPPPPPPSAAAAPAPAPAPAPGPPPAPAAAPPPAAGGGVAGGGPSPAAAAAVPPAAAAPASAAAGAAAGARPGAVAAAPARPAASVQRPVTAFLQPSSAQPAPVGGAAAPPPVGPPRGSYAAATAAAAPLASPASGSARAPKARAKPPASRPGLARGFFGPASAAPGASGEAGPSASAPPAKRPLPARSGSSSGSGGPAPKRPLPAASAEATAVRAMLAQGYDWLDVGLTLGYGPEDFDMPDDLDLDDGGLDYGGVPMRDEGLD
jgi:hypothetical protein